MTVREVLKLLPHKDIVKNGVLYLRRHFLTPNIHWLPRLYLHLINRPDEDRHPHDHPGWFVTIPLWGGYLEEIYESYDQLRGTAPPRLHRAKPFRIYFRRASFTHKVVSFPRRGRAWTLVLFGPNRTTWGFWVAGSFVPEAQYKEAEDRK